MSSEVLFGLSFHEMLLAVGDTPGAVPRTI
jgi:hypothetical protein